MGYQMVNVDTDADVEVLPDGDVTLEQIAALAKDGKPAADPVDDDEDPVAEADADADPDVEVVDDVTDPRDKGKPVAAPVTPEDDFIVTDAELQSYKARRTQERIQTLARKGHEERRAKEDAIRRESVAIDYAKKVHAEAQAMREKFSSMAQQQLESQRAATEAALREAQAEYKEAVEAADPEKMSAATTKLSRTSAMLSALPEAPRQAPAVSPPPAMEQYSPKLAAWVSRNQWFTKDQRLNQMAMAYHNVAVTQGIPPDSDVYYDFIDRNMSAHVGGTAPATVPEPKPAPAQQKQARYVAPVNPGSGGAAQTAPKKSGKITLTKSEVEIARAIGVPLVEYAKQKQARERMSS